MRRMTMFLAAVGAAVAQVLVVAPPAHAYEVHISISGAGQVVETTPANLVGSGCTTSASNPTGTIGANCYPGDPSGDYGWGWTVRLVATAKPGYRFVQWQSDGSSGSPVLCDSANGSSTYTGSACQFATHDNLQLRAVFVDDTAPTMASLSGPNQAVNGSTAFTFAAAADPTVQGFECRVANVHDWVSCTSGRQENPALSGLYTFEVRAVDSSGNRSPISSWPWTVDKIAPVTTVTSAPSGTVASTSATFEFTSNEPGTFSCALNAVSIPCTSPKTLTGLSQGTYTFSVMARDVAGNNSALVTRTFTVDTVAPNTGLTGGPTEGTKVATASASFGLTSTEGTSSFACTLDGASLPCNATTGLTGLGQGSHTFTAAAVDAAGNTDPTPATRTWTVDTVAPTASSARPTGSRVSLDSNASVVFSEAMKKATVEAATNGVPKNFYLSLGGTKVRAVVTYTQTASGAFKAVLNPARKLRPGRTYKLGVTSGALDRAGNALAARSWTFRTRG
jgi:Bacterial Ig-like domain